MSDSKLDSLLGASMSIEGGFDQALYRGKSIGCKAIKIFTHNNRQWETKDITEEEINKFEKAKKETDISCVLSHVSHLIDLSSSSEDTRKKSFDMLMEEFRRCEELKIKKLIMPTGYCKGEKNKCFQEIIGDINIILSKTTRDITLLIENMAGEGSAIGATFKEIGHVVNNVIQKDRIGVCFNTSHAWDTGYDFSTPEKYKEMWEDFNKRIGIQKLKAILISNSKTALDSHIDKNATIDKGRIPIEAFKLIMNDERFVNIPKILDLPESQNQLERDKENLNILRDLIK